MAIYCGMLEIPSIGGVKVANGALFNRISNVGIVVPDQNNTNSHNHEHSIRVVGEYEGSTEATFVVEILLNGDAFRWKKHTDST